MVAEKDATEITDIYNHYVLTSTATFEVDTISVQDMKARIAAITGTYPWLVLEEEDGIAGYAYASTFRERAA
jgi:phosphinothricin acetyltransferase